MHNETLIAVGRKNYLFAGSDAGAERAACVYTLVAEAPPGTNVAVAGVGFAIVMVGGALFLAPI
jgi:hypothetical protein